MEAGARPQALLDYESVCVEMDEELLVAARRASDAGGSEFDRGGLLVDVEGHGRDALAHDRWVGRVGRRFCDADASYAFDSWTSAEVVSLAESVVASGVFPSSPEGGEVGGLLDRLHADGRGDLAEAIAELPLPQEERRGFWNGVWDGLTVGAFEPEPYDDAAGRWGKGVGELVSGWAIYGDVRDGVAEYSRGNWVGGTFNLAGAVPYIGDGLKLIKFGARAGDLTRGIRHLDEAVDLASNANRLFVVRASDMSAATARARRGEWNVPGGLLAHEGSKRGHVIKRHVISDDALEQRLAKSTKKDYVSTFVDDFEADAAIGAVLSGRRRTIARWLSGSDPQLTVGGDFPDGIGRVLARHGGGPEAGHRLSVVLQREPHGELGYYVATVMIE